MIWPNNSVYFSKKNIVCFLTCQGWIISDALLNPGRARFSAHKEQ
jgi:hypothetical protein